MSEVDIICAGINHQTWYIQVLYQGVDWANKLLEGFERHPEYSRTEKVRIDMIRRFGYFSTESNGHLSEYVATSLPTEPDDFESDETPARQAPRPAAQPPQRPAGPAAQPPRRPAGPAAPSKPAARTATSNKGKKKRKR